MLRRKSITILAAGLLSATAVVAGCNPAPLTDVRQILDNTITAMTPDTSASASPGPGKLQSFHFVLDAGGQFLVGIPTTTPTPTPLPTQSPEASPSASPTQATTVEPSPASPTPLTSAEASASAAAAAASASASAAEASASAQAAEASASAAAASASASAEAAASASPTPTPTPYYTALPFGLKDAHAEGDIDLVHSTAHITGWMPSIPGVSGELLVIDPYVYTRTYGQTQYRLGYASQLPINPALASGAYFIVEQVLAIANDPNSNPVLVGTEQEPYGPAYHVRVDITPSAANSKLAASGQLLGSGQLDLWILQDGFWLERMEFSTADPTAGAAAVRIVFSNYNHVQPMTYPPDSQVWSGESPSATP